MPIILILLIVWVAVVTTQAGILFPLRALQLFTVPQLIVPVVGCILIAWCLDE